MKINNQTDLAKLITVLDKREDEEGNQLSYTHATSISWKIIKGYKEAMSKRELIKYVINNLPVLHVAPENGNERKSKFSHSQVSRVIGVLDEMLKWYWIPFSGIRRSLKRICK